MVKNPMADAINNVDVTEVYEIIKEAEPIIKPFGEEAVYNYDNVLAENIDLRDVLKQKKNINDED